jgi:hypothetical protein
MRLTKADLDRLNTCIEDDYVGAVADHQRRMERFARYYQKWRNRVDEPAAGEEDKPNFSVPVMQWQVFAKWASALDALLGDDAEITAVPTGPSDHRYVHKISRFMQWRAFESMEILNPLAIYMFRQILFGRSFAYAPWVKDTYKTPKGPQTWYEGPGFTPLWPGELIVPAEDAQSIHDFTFVIRRVFLTPQALLDGEADGRYNGISDNWEKLISFSQTSTHREDEPDKAEKDEAEGVTFDGSLAGKNTLEVHEWYGKYRPVRGGKPTFEEHELVCRRIPGLNMLIGIEDLMDLYPWQRNRRPFVEGALVEDGSYWSPGFGELLESIEDEVTNNHRLFTEAMQFGVGPVVFYKPSAGFNPDSFKYEPQTAVPSEDPGAVNPVLLKADLQGPIAKEQAVVGYGEKVTGVSEQTLGRAIDRPNAPRTATGQVALLEQGNIRASLDVKFLREGMRKMLRHFWDLETSFATDGDAVFFRVTEEDAKGLFDVRQGGATMTAKERAGRYDFSIRFATSIWDRESRKERQLQLYGLSLQNPLIATNPRALWSITNKTFKEMGEPNFGDLLPEPPDMGMPKHPREEWTLMLQGEDVDVNPMDDDDIHLVDHFKRFQDAKQSQEPDEDAMQRMVGHIADHQQQKRYKMLMQQLTASLADSLAENTQNPEQGGLNARGPMPAGLQDVQNVLTELAGGGEPGAGQPPRKPPGSEGGQRQ